MTGVLAERTEPYRGHEGWRVRGRCLAGVGRTRAGAGGLQRARVRGGAGLRARPGAPRHHARRLGQRLALATRGRSIRSVEVFGDLVELPRCCGMRGGVAALTPRSAVAPPARSSARLRSSPSLRGPSVLRLGSCSPDWIAVDDSGVDVGAPADGRGVAEVRGHRLHRLVIARLRPWGSSARVVPGERHRRQDRGVPRSEVLGAEVARRRLLDIGVDVVGAQVAPAPPLLVGQQLRARPSGGASSARAPARPRGRRSPAPRLRPPFAA